MKKKDYELIAKSISFTADYQDFDKQPVVDRVAIDLADRLEKSGYKFDRQKFLTACGIETGVRVDFTKDPEWAKAQFETENQ